MGSNPSRGTSFTESQPAGVLAAVANRMEATALAVGMSALRHFGKLTRQGWDPIGNR